MSDTQTAAPARLVLRRTYRASRERVFAAWTDPKAVARFFGPGDVTVEDVRIDPRVGGTYSVTFRQPDGETMVAGGVYRELRKPERIVCTWSWEEDDPALKRETLLTLEFLDRSGETELVLTHENFRDSDQRDRHEGGWSAILEQLTGFVAPLGIAGIDLSGYMVKDAARAIAFYRDVLGLEPTRVYPENRGAEYEFPDGTTFGLWGGGNGTIPFQPSNGILFAVADLDAAVATLKARGVPIALELQLANCRMAGFADTEGNSVFLHERKAPSP
jgi:uncharacterized protein YndB with AHSA1/START domain/predicted enzyme related to lactoylglutathione lyase